MGRHRLLTLEIVLEAALALGLDKITMKTLAEQLGVAVSTLYHYVRHRDDLLQLMAARRRSAQHVFRDEGQHWTELLVAAYAWSSFEFLRANPALLTLLIQGHLGPETEADMLESLLAGLVRRGFDNHDALRLHAHTTTLAVGLASLDASTRNRAQAVQELLAARGEGLPHLQACAHGFAHYDTSALFDAQLQRLLRNVAEERGENPPHNPNRALAA